MNLVNKKEICNSNTNNQNRILDTFLVFGSLTINPVNWKYALSVTETLLLSESFKCVSLSTKTQHWYTGDRGATTTED